jgi:hypothetical protein
VNEKLNSMREYPLSSSEIITILPFPRQQFRVHEEIERLYYMNYSVYDIQGAKGRKTGKEKAVVSTNLVRDKP